MAASMDKFHIFVITLAFVGQIQAWELSKKYLNNCQKTNSYVSLQVGYARFGHVCFKQ